MMWNGPVMMWNGPSRNVVGGSKGDLLHHSVQVPAVGDALQLALTRILKHQARTRHEILYGARHEHCAWRGERKLDRNPVTAADRPRASRKEMRTWTADELGGFLDGAREHRFAPLFTVLATTGLRRGEALGLRWSDVDLDEGRLAVRQTLLAVNNHVQFGEPKTHRSRRTVDLDAATVAVLKAHPKSELEERAGAGLGRPRADGLIFTDEQGDPLHPNVVSRMFGKLVREVHLPIIRLHDLRHTHATLSLQAGVHVKIVSERLGHSSVTITLDTYSHAIPGLQRDAAERVAALIPGLGR
jgi:integrase